MERWRTPRAVFLCFAPLMALVALSDPLGLPLLPVLFMLKDGLHVPPERLALFEAGLEVPAYLGFCFGWLRDRHIDGSAIGDSGGIAIAAVAAALAYAALAHMGPAAGLPSVFALLLLAALLMRCAFACAQAMLVGWLRAGAPAAALSAAGEVGQVTGAASALLVGGWLAHAWPLADGLAATIVPCLLLCAWALAFRHRLPPVAARASAPQDTHHSRHHGPRHWRAFGLVLFAWNFSPVFGTPLLYFLTGQRGFSAADFGAFRAIYYVTMALAPFAYQRLADRAGRLGMARAVVAASMGASFLLLLVHSLAWGVIVAILLGGLVGFGNVALLDLTRRALPTEGYGTAIMVVLSARSVAGAVGDVFGAWLYGAHGLLPCLIVESAAMAAICVLMPRHAGHDDSLIR
jgi:hypothetical protein